MGSVSSSYDVNGKETGTGAEPARSRSRGDVAGTDARVDKLARLMTSHQKKRRHPGTAFHMEREDEEFDSNQVSSYVKASQLPMIYPPYPIQSGHISTDVAR